MGIGTAAPATTGGLGVLTLSTAEKPCVNFQSTLPVCRSASAGSTSPDGGILKCLKETNKQTKSAYTVGLRRSKWTVLFKDQQYLVCVCFSFGSKIHESRLFVCFTHTVPGLDSGTYQAFSKSLLDE